MIESLALDCTCVFTREWVNGRDERTFSFCDLHTSLLQAPDHVMKVLHYWPPTRAKVEDAMQRLYFDCSCSMFQHEHDCPLYMVSNPRWHYNPLRETFEYARTA